MRKIIATVATFFILLSPASSDDVPFASPPHEETPQQLGLGDLMSLTQMRHIKLWYAGRAKNWPLVQYEIAQIQDTLYRAALRYRNIPVEAINEIWEPLTALKAAANASDFDQFNRNYANLTTSCNACHQAGGVDFIHIQTPVSSPFTDQTFEHDRHAE